MAIEETLDDTKAAPMRIVRFITNEWQGVNVQQSVVTHRLFIVRWFYCILCPLALCVSELVVASFMCVIANRIEPFEHGAPHRK